MILKLVCTASLFLSASGAFADAVIHADRQSVDVACSAESATAGCGNEKVGTGLLKCIGAFKKANPTTFQVSPGCKQAMHQLRADKNAGK